METANGRGWAKEALTVDELSFEELMKRCENLRHHVSQLRRLIAKSDVTSDSATNDSDC